jgi:hypothetical protein
MSKTGEYNLHANTNERIVLLYGDGLSISNWGHCYMQLFTQMCQQGRKKSAKSVLEAYNRILPQKGLFHQLMHQTDVVFKIFYGGFLQPIQVAIGEKRVSGMVIKNYKTHENFMIKTYLSCMRYTHRCFFKSIDEEDLIFKVNESPSIFLARLREMYKEFREMREKSPHEPSCVVLLFMEMAASV